MAKISKRTVDAAPVPATGRAYLWDGKLSGFGLVVQPTGSKSYVYQYRAPEGRTRRITIGRHGDPLTPELAREKAMELGQAVKAGIDPLTAKQERRKAATVADVLDLYLNSPAFTRKTAITQANYRGRITRHLVPLLGRKISDQLTADEVRQAFADITRARPLWTFGRVSVAGRVSLLVKARPAWLFGC